MGDIEDEKSLDPNYRDPVTGLSLSNDEKLIRAREAMILAVQLFNSTTFRFKTEVFCVLANIAWTYLLHEYYKRRTNVDIIQESGRSLLLSQPRLFMGHVDKGFQPGVFVRSESGFS